MVLCVYGFPSKRAALYFEWSWQHPEDAKVLRDVIKEVKRVGHKQRLQAKIRYLFEMLNISPWNRMPLTVHWLTTKYHSHLEKCKSLPRQITTETGSLDMIYVYRNGQYEPDDELDDNNDSEDGEIEFAQGIGSSEGKCSLCLKPLEKRNALSCSHQCSMVAHARCFALHFLEYDNSELLPTTSRCPTCDKTLLWPVLIKAKREESRQWHRIGAREKGRNQNSQSDREPSFRDSLKKRVEISLLDDESVSGIAMDFGSFDEEQSSDDSEPARKKQKISSEYESQEFDIPTIPLPTTRVSLESESSAEDSDEDLYMSLKERIEKRKTASNQMSHLVDLDIDGL